MIICSFYHWFVNKLKEIFFLLLLSQQLLPSGKNTTEDLRVGDTLFVSVSAGSHTSMTTIIWIQFCVGIHLTQFCHKRNEYLLFFHDL